MTLISKIYNTFSDKLKNLDKKILKIMDFGFIFSFILSIISTIILFTYISFYNKPILFYIGIELFKSSLMFVVIFIIFGIGFDTIKKEMI